MKIPGYKSTAGSVRGGNSRFQGGMPPGYPQQMMRMQMNQTQAKPQTGPKREVKWLVAVEDNSALKIVVTSQKGGTKVKELNVK